MRTPLSDIPAITFKEAISHIHYDHIGGYPKGAEYLGGEFIETDRGVRWANHLWVPSAQVVDTFKKVIGDKWDHRETTGFIGQSLSQTGIVIDWNCIVARGGLCPGGVRLFRIVDTMSLSEFITAFFK